MDDKQRRSELRSFLLVARGRLAPRDVGLPDTERRRVPGLRREEVAELAGVTDVWYRWFESGRDVRVSEQFLERLSRALRLDARDEVTLYRLALAGLYRADRALRETGGRAVLDEHAVIDDAPDGVLSEWSASPIATDMPSAIDAAAVTFALARERFLTERTSSPAHARSRIVRSWQRSRGLGVDFQRREVRFSARRDVDLAERRAISERLLRASKGVVKHLADCLTTTGYAITVADGSGCLLTVEGDLDVRRQLAKHHFVPGGDWSEEAAGTNAIGTALADGRPLQLMAAEHFCDGWRPFTCTAAPIRVPGTGECIGALDISGDYRLVRRHLVAMVVECAYEIEERLLDLV